MENSNDKLEFMRFFSAIRAFNTMSDEERAEVIKLVKENVKADEEENPDQPLNLIVTDEAEWPPEWVDAINELQAGLD